MRPCPCKGRNKECAQCGGTGLVDDSAPELEERDWLEPSQLPGVRPALRDGTNAREHADGIRLEALLGWVAETNTKIGRPLQIDLHKCVLAWGKHPGKPIDRRQAVALAHQMLMWSWIRWKYRDLAAAACDDSIVAAARDTYDILVADSHIYERCGRVTIGRALFRGFPNETLGDVAKRIIADDQPTPLFVEDWRGRISEADY